MNLLLANGVVDIFRLREMDGIREQQEKNRKKKKNTQHMRIDREWNVESVKPKERLSSDVILGHAYMLDFTVMLSCKGHRLLLLHQRHGFFF